MEMVAMMVDGMLEGVEEEAAISVAVEEAMVVGICGKDQVIIMTMGEVSLLPKAVVSFYNMLWQIYFLDIHQFEKYSIALEKNWLRMSNHESEISKNWTILLGFLVIMIGVLEYVML